jgi:hypothetical protein
MKKRILSSLIFICSLQQIFAQSSSVAPDKIITSKIGIGTSTVNGQLQFANAPLSNRRIVFLEETNNDHQFFGFGLNDNILRYQVANGNSSHVFYAGNVDNSIELMRINGNGNVSIPYGSLSVAGLLQIDDHIINETPSQPTLQNGWENFGLEYGLATFYKDKENLVHLSGMIKNGFSGGGSIVFTLPSGYRPGSRLVFPVVLGETMGIIHITSTGDVIKYGLGNSYLSLSGITFRAN